MSSGGAFPKSRARCRSRRADTKATVAYAPLLAASMGQTVGVPMAVPEATPTLHRRNDGRRPCPVDRNTAATAIAGVTKRPTTTTASPCAAAPVGPFGTSAWTMRYPGERWIMNSIRFVVLVAILHFSIGAVFAQTSLLDSGAAPHVDLTAVQKQTVYQSISETQKHPRASEPPLVPWCRMVSALRRFRRPSPAFRTIIKREAPRNRSVC